MSEPTPQDPSIPVEPLDPERAKIVGSIYEVLLRPEHFTAFMDDWSTFIDRAARRSGALNGTEPALSDPVIEAHFERASALFARLGRGEGDASLAGPPAEPIAQIFHGSLIMASKPPAALRGLRDLSGLIERLTPDSAARLSDFLRAFEQSPASGRFVVLALAQAPSALEGGLLSVTTRHDRQRDGFVADVRALSIGWTGALAQVMADSFGLTPREIELVAQMIQGGDLPTIARRVDRSMNTLRAQLKSIFAKTRTTSQPELMRLVAVLMMHGIQPVDQSQATTQDIRKLRLSDGRVLTLREMGPIDGVPVVFVHGMLEGMGSFRRLAPFVGDAGLRLLAPNRSNFGQGSADPRLRDAPSIFARDVAEMMDMIGLDRVVLCAHLAGSVPAYACAQHLGPRCAGLMAVSGNVPILSIDQFATMTPRQRAVAYTARFAPALLPAIIRAGVAQIDGKSAIDFARSLYPKGTSDAALVEVPEIAEALIEGYRYTVAQGIRGFQSDAWHVTRDWSVLVTGLRCPVLLVHGAQDRVVSPESVQAFAARNRGFVLDTIAGAGQLLLYGRPQAMADRIARFARTCLAANGDA